MTVEYFEEDTSTKAFACEYQINKANLHRQYNDMIMIIFLLAKEYYKSASSFFCYSTSKDYEKSYQKLVGVVYTDTAC